MKTPSLHAFKAWARDCAPAARAVLMAQAFAELERERVNAYVLPIFQAYKFEYAERWAPDLAGPIPDMDHLYLCDDEPGLKAYYAECDEAHRAHGFTGPTGHCPALRAENLHRETQRALINLAEPLFGITSDQVWGENRARYLDLLIGACLKAERDKSAARRVTR